MGRRQKNDRSRKRGERLQRDTQEPPRRTECRLRNREASRRDVQLMGNEKVPAKKGGWWC
jgi:hypothetical protein